MAKKGLTKTDERDIEGVFNALDINGDGLITTEELKTGLRVIYDENFTEKEFNQIFKDLGLKQGDTIKFDKFRSSMAQYLLRSKKRTPEEKKKELNVAFKVFDKDGSGFIDKKELTDMLMTLGDKMSKQEVDKMFKLADTDENGKISTKEFINLMTKNIK